MLRHAFLAALVLVTGCLQSLAAPIGFRDLMDRPRKTPDHIVHFGAHPHQFGELWLPAGKGPFATVVVVHGGCWLAELPGPELMAYMSADLRDRGYAVWSIDYRRIGDAGGGYPGTFQDAAAALDMLRDLAAKYPLDLNKVVAVGHSAGGHLATWLAARRGIPRGSVLHAANPFVLRGVVSLAGINDLEAYRADGPDACGGPPTIDALVSASARTGVDVYADTSPVRLLPSRAGQAVISGALDHIVPPAFGDSYAARAIAKGDIVVKKTIADAGHFELIDPTAAAWKDVLGEIEALLK